MTFLSPHQKHGSIATSVGVYQPFVSHCRGARRPQPVRKAGKYPRLGIARKMQCFDSIMYKLMSNPTN